MSTIYTLPFTDMNAMKKTVRFLFILLFSINTIAQTPPKREFRGTWIHTVGQAKYAKMSMNEMKSYFTNLLDKLQKSGINVVLFQVRPEADAWYDSPYEPWSRYITGEQGKDPGWDPLAFMVKECHKRNIDIHAWLNPYRVRTSPTKVLAKTHIYFKHPEWFIDYGEYTWFDPGNPECLEFIETVVKDIVKRYDIDGIHLDDYFYPYPIVENKFDDSKSFRTYGLEKGYTINQEADWRRENVNILIRDLHQDIHKIKPWVLFGVSPFGIYRNYKKDPNGSQTNGLSDYDDLFADVLLWLKNGWVDYNIPQVYWEIGHKTADYEVLIDWWSRNNYGKPLYIGQDILRTIKPDSLKISQLYRKMMMTRKNGQVTGNCFWPGYELERNTGGIADSLRSVYHKYPALYPADNRYDQVPPKNITNLIYINDTNRHLHLSWKAPIAKQEMDKAVYFVVYRFDSQGDINLEDSRNIVSVTRTAQYEIPKNTPPHKVYVVTALDRCHNESQGEFIEVPE
ncbi:MAG: family 10 glycosylhydrolase [Bacteroidales bacterium]|nr:family 10 glycosylhydrolase [Bacteroidales bacterium]